MSLKSETVFLHSLRRAKDLVEMLAAQGTLKAHRALLITITFVGPEFAPGPCHLPEKITIGS